MSAEAAAAPSAPARPNWLGIAALLLLSGLTAWVSVRYTRFEGVSSVWIADGLLVGALQLSPRATWRWWLAAAFVGQAAARVVIHDPWAMVLVLSLVNLLESFLGASYVRRDVEVLAHARSLGKVAFDSLLATLVACALSATLALPILLQRAGVQAGEAWLTWFGAHVLGIVIVATLTVCAFQPQLHLRFGMREALGLLLELALLCLACVFTFAQSHFPCCSCPGCR